MRAAREYLMRTGFSQTGVGRRERTRMGRKRRPRPTATDRDDGLDDDRELEGEKPGDDRAAGDHAAHTVVDSLEFRRAHEHVGRSAEQNVVGSRAVIGGDDRGQIR